MIRSTMDSNSYNIIPTLLVKYWALWGERERSGRHYSDQQTVQHSVQQYIIMVQQPGRTLLLNNVEQSNADEAAGSGALS